MPTIIRTVPGFDVLDPSAIANITYNDAAGSEKTSEVGRLNLPFPVNTGGTITYTTNLTTALPLPKKGMGLAVYNNSGTVGSITLGVGSAPLSLAPGVTDASGHVGVPCPPNSWSYIATGNNNWVISSASTLLVFLIADNSSVVNQQPAQTPGY